jgi:hypothetical protein
MGLVDTADIRVELSVLAYSVVLMDDVAMLERMRDMQRIIASTQAELAATMAAFVARARDGILAGEFATDEIAVALRCGRGRVLNQGPARGDDADQLAGDVGGVAGRRDGRLHGVADRGGCGSVGRPGAPGAI